MIEKCIIIHVQSYTLQVCGFQIEALKELPNQFFSVVDLYIRFIGKTILLVTWRASPGRERDGVDQGKDIENLNYSF